MKEIKLIIDGKEVQLTDEQLKVLGIDVENKRNPFERVNDDNEYYYIKTNGKVSNYCEERDRPDNELYDNINYFNDEQFANQVALRQLLYRKLLKFAYDNGFEDTAEWNGANEHWLIIYHKLDDDFTIVNMEAAKELSVYFSTEEGASRAITEVIRPFIKEHPDFVW